MLLTVLLALLMAPGEARAQFGPRFGKNKVIYKDFEWSLYKSPHFDVYYYKESEPFLEQVVSYAESAFLHLKESLDHEPKFRIPLIYYKTHGDFEQTNITLEFIPESVGAFAEPLEKRMVVPIDQPADKLYALIAHELTHIFEYSILYQDSTGRAIRGGPPGWLMEGLASFMARDEDSIDQMIIRDAVVNGLVPPITRVYGLNFLTYRFGHAAFDFIEQEFGPEGIRSFLAEYRKVLLTGSIEKSIKESFGTDADEFDRRFRRYLMKKYVPLLLERNEPEDHGTEIGTKLPGVFSFSPALSPSGDLIAIMTTKAEELDVAIINAKDGEMIRNLTKGLTLDYDHLTAAIFQGKNDLSWSPGGDEVAVFARRANRRVLLLYNAVTGKQVLDVELDVDEAESPAFSPDGKRIAFAANREGQVDIFEYNLEKKTLTNITNDTFNDSNPAWSADGKTILYNRRINAYEKVFLMEYDDPSQKTQVTFGETSDVQPSFSRDGKRIYYASDAGEHRIFNIYSLDLETGEVRQYTDVVSGMFTPFELPEMDGKTRLVSTAYWRGRYRLYQVETHDPVKVIKPEERVQEPAEIVPFKPSLQLTLDEAEKQPYTKKEFHLETSPDVGVGVASDGTVFGNAYLIFSDLLGDHRIWVNAQAVGAFTNIDTGYVNMKKRTQWFAGFRDYRDFLILPTSSGDFVKEQSNRTTRLRGGLIYPLSTYTRVVGTVGVQNRDIVSTNFATFDTTPDPSLDPNEPPPPPRDPNVPDVTFGLLNTETQRGTSAFVAASWIHDTVRFREFGPWHGKRINLTLGTTPTASGSLGTYQEYLLDARFYHRVTKRSLLAWRIFGNIGVGEGTELFGIGGYDMIRGFQYRELVGDQGVFTNIEFRFPLLDELRFPFGSLRQIRGVVYFDAGSAWTQDGFYYDREIGVFRDYDLYDSEENRLRDGRASFGIGFSFQMGYFYLNWNFSRRLPYGETQTNRACEDAFLASETLADIATAFATQCPIVEVDDSSLASDFYIGYQF